jgi:hypothetical protein
MIMTMMIMTIMTMMTTMMMTRKRRTEMVVAVVTYLRYHSTPPIRADPLIGSTVPCWHFVDVPRVVPKMFQTRLLDPRFRSNYC